MPKVIAKPFTGPDPDRIKKLLGKTAQLNFRLVSENSEFGVDELISEIGEKLKVSRI